MELLFVLLGGAAEGIAGMHRLGANEFVTDPSIDTRVWEGSA